MKELSDELLAKLQSSITIMDEFSSQQKSDVQITGMISGEVTKMFSEMSSAVENQSTSLDRKIHDIVEAYVRLDLLISELKALANQRT